ncbi:MAG: SpoIIE family protein phosphatase [Gemmatimonadetes bacterium]|nr:SpoIIE family protein phosphatase [Gemmatimonadota bacterium]
MNATPSRILVLSSRPDIVDDVANAARSLEPSPIVRGLFGRTLAVDAADLILVDVAEPKATTSYLRRRFGSDPSLVALIDGAWVAQLGSTLAGDWSDYLFYPLNQAELGLVWRRHATRAESPDLSLDVDEDGQLRVAIPADVTYQRPVVERIVEACRHLGDLDSEAAFRLRVALGEAVANAILYGSEDRPGAVVRITANIATDGLRVSVRDEGDGFDPTAIPDPTAERGIARSHGRGLFLLHQLSDDVAFNEVGNRVTLLFRTAVDPLYRARAWLPPFAELTGLDFRLDRLEEGGATCVFDTREGEGDGREGPRDRVLHIGEDERLRLEFTASSDDGASSPAATLLTRWLEVVAEGEAARDRLVERRMRRARVLAELENARDLQLRLLPAPAAFSDLGDVAARCEPALSLGGDFYYLNRLPGSRLGVMLGDVSSHGPSAALIMALTLSAVAVVTSVEPRPAAALDAMHGQLLQALESTEMYMTLFYGVLDTRARTLTYANAGHPYAYRIRASDVERLDALDPPVGMLDASNYHERSVAWGSDDTLLAFTDGLAELRDPLDESSSTVRALIASGEATPERLVEALFAGTDDEMHLDDRTAVAARL